LIEKGKKMTPRELEDRLIDFAVEMITITEGLPSTPAGKHVAIQLLRSGTSPAPNYAEAQGAESTRDFVHKIKIGLKELRETMVWLKIISRKSMAPSADVERAKDECNQLIAIFVASTKTADKRLPKKS